MHALALLVCIALAVCSQAPLCAFGACASAARASTSQKDDAPSGRLAQLSPISRTPANPHSTSRARETAPMLPSSTLHASARKHNSKAHADADSYDVESSAQKRLCTAEIWTGPALVSLSIGLSAVLLAACAFGALYLCFVYAPSLGLNGPDAAQLHKVALTTEGMFALTPGSMVAPTPGSTVAPTVASTVAPTPVSTPAFTPVPTKTSTPPSIPSAGTKIPPPSSLTDQKLTVARKDVDVSWCFSSASQVDVRFKTRFCNALSQQKDVVFSKDAAPLKKIMDIAKPLVNSRAYLSAREKAHTLENIEQILSSDALHTRVPERLLDHYKLSGDKLFDVHSTDPRAMKNGLLYYSPRNKANYLYRDKLNTAGPKNSALLALWLLSNGVKDFQEGADAAFPGFSNYVLRKSIIKSYNTQIEMVQDNRIASLMYFTTAILNQLNTYNPPDAPPSASYSVKTWLLENPSSPAQDTSATFAVPNAIMNVLEECYTNLDMAIAAVINELLITHGSLDSVVEHLGTFLN